ncbi:class I SAM-dependent methyltransferase [Kibdelosporangium philippinense]|uniref:Class I SAM-dependent methyltransferase n=1 Tax=Kibdelosporangium philippinense TaxID=211113 RepID=A0ABS8ZI60_9PSEU|nr:class I SAM-dependent methyltransferase [Kibdelosporangium philippinense]MCE7006311.1 class I SAM-dependent methyltransferase [Kibdelosporangium philippinense]
MPRYTHGHHEAVLRSHRTRTVANSAAYLLPYLNSEMSLLDVGCGPGTITADFADLVATVTAIEPVAEALALAQDHVQKPNVRFEVADVFTLPYADKTFDVVHAHQVLQHLHDPIAALREMRRVSKGIVAARDSDYTAFAWYPAVPALDDWLALYKKVAYRNGGEPDAGRRLFAWARAAGFTDVAASASVWCYATPEERSWWGGMWADRILQTAIAEQAEAYGYATRSDLQRISDGWREWADLADGWFSLLHGEIICRG